jgi:hypothetical protein
LPVEAEGVEVSRLVVGGPRPLLVTEGGVNATDSDEAVDAWQTTLERLVQTWV